METTSYMGPIVEIAFDQTQGVYIGSLTTTQGTRNFVGPDYQTVSIDITRAYEKECEALARLIEKGEEQEDAPNWSPDGRWIVYERAESKGGETDLYRIDIHSCQ